MAIRTQQSISGFIATDPQLTVTDRGEARFYARCGQENFHREDDRSFTKLEPSVHNLVMYRATAERAFERFTKRDSFVAEGYAHEYSYERDGQSLSDEEFVAKKIGHDTARTRYEVDRSPPKAASQETVQRQQERAFDPPSRRPTTSTSVLGR